MARIVNRVEQQERISRAVWEVMAESGPQNLTLRAVAERAGCTTGLVMHTFPNKKAMLEHARQQLHMSTSGRMDALAAQNLPAAEELREILMQANMSHSADKLNDSRVWLGFLASALGDAGLTGVHVDANRDFISRVEAIVARARADWDAQHVTLITSTLIALVEGLNVLATADTEHFSPGHQGAAISGVLEAIGLAG
jgi:TetR/AcrR family transcriptional repressor of bet genes